MADVPLAAKFRTSRAPSVAQPGPSKTESRTDRQLACSAPTGMCLGFPLARPKWTSRAHQFHHRLQDQVFNLHVVRMPGREREMLCDHVQHRMEQVLAEQGIPAFGELDVTHVLARAPFREVESGLAQPLIPVGVLAQIAGQARLRLR